MLWQELVTDGHVRAGRLRRRRGLIVALAVCLLLLGLVLISAVPSSRGAYAVSQPANALLTSLKSAINTRLERARPLQLKVAEINGLVPAAELASVAGEIAKGLAANGKIPEELKHEMVSLARFWEFSWPLDRLVVAQTEDYVVVGGIVGKPCVPADAVAESRTDALRWIAIYKRSDRRWMPANLRMAGSCAAPGLPMVSPDHIVETLRVLLDVPLR
jgi:hypothetical protein